MQYQWQQKDKTRESVFRRWTLLILRLTDLHAYLVHRCQGDLAVQWRDFCVSEGRGQQHTAPHGPSVCNVQLHTKGSALGGKGWVLRVEFTVEGHTL